MNIDKLPDYLYFVVMGLAAVGWLGLILFPRQRLTNFWLAGLFIPLALCLLYMYLLLTFWFRDPPANIFQFVNLDGVAAMFRNKGLLLVAWINLIMMDLVGGAWMTRKAAQIRMPYVYLLPCLIMTFVFAGFGFTLFAIMASVGGGGWPQIAKFEGQPPYNTAPVFARPGVS